MIRRLEGEKSAFVLDTNATTYVLSIAPSGHVEHLYYGTKINITDAAECDVFREKREFEPGNVIAYSHDFNTTVLEDMCLEMSSGGHGDIREPFLELVRENGVRSSDFKYASYVITDGRSPLRTLLITDGRKHDGWFSALLLYALSQQPALPHHQGLPPAETTVSFIPRLSYPVSASPAYA